MKIYLPEDFSGSIGLFLKRAGYSERIHPQTGQPNYVRRLGGDFYPRFHVYIEQSKDGKQFLSLHLDQKKPSYAGAHAHNAEHDGERIEQEGNRISNLLKFSKDYIEVNKSENKNTFWEKFFK